jgi:hypothetical protein
MVWTFESWGRKPPHGRGSGEAAGEVNASDIATYDRQHDEIVNFLRPHGPWAISDAVITNPPYGGTVGPAFSPGHVVTR